MRKVNPLALLAVTSFEGGYTLGAGRNRHDIYNISFDEIKKNVLKRSTVLAVSCNVSYDSEYIADYEFSQELLKKDSFLRSLLFGRKTADYQFTATAAIMAQLSNKYCAYIVKVRHVSEYDFSANCGVQKEEKAVNDGAKKTSTIMDKRYKVDVVKDHHNIQCKASIVHKGSNGKSWSCSKTNGSVK